MAGRLHGCFDTVNEAGGINGRTLEPVFTPIVPASADQGTAACTALTDDDSVFVVLGNYVDENAPCIVTPTKPRCSVATLR